MEFKRINYDFIEKWIVEHNEQAWLKNYWADYAKEHNGKEVPFIVLKRAFCEKFMPEAIPGGKKSMKDRIANL